MSVIWTVAKREFLEIVRTRSYWLLVLMMPALLVAGLLVGGNLAGNAESIDSEVLVDAFREVGVRQLPVFLPFLILIVLVQSMQYLISNTVEEKSSRIIEMLLSSITPDELMQGKLLGVGLAISLSVSIWLLSLLAIAYTAFSFLTDSSVSVMSGIIGEILGFDLLLLLLFYLKCSYALYSGIFLAIGALCDTLKEAQGMMGPISLLIFLPLVISPFAVVEGSEGLIRVLTWIPLFTPYLMLGRLNSGAASLMEVIGSSVLLIASIYLVIWLSARIFRYGVLRTGQPPKMAEIIRSLRTS